MDFDRARAFMTAHARPLERALFAWRFEDGPADAVREALRAHANPDGGFGHAIEPDIRLDASAPYFTTIGLDALRRIGAGADDPLVAGALRYLVATYDPAARAWQKVPAAVDGVPHAFWWSDPQPPAGFEANIGAEVLGYFLLWPGVAPAELVAGLEAAAREALAAPGDAAGDALEMHDLLCWTRLAELAPPDLRAAVVARLKRALPLAVPADPSAWTGYALRPLAVAPAPDSPVASLVGGGVAADLDLTEDEQGPDGAWSPPWDWSAADAAAWEVAKAEWKGVLTLKALTSLRAYGRV